MHCIMETLLTTVALVVLVLVIAAVSRWVGKERSEVAGGRLLSVVVTLFLVIFAAVSLSASSQLAEGSGTTKLVLFLFLMVIAVLLRVSWAKAEAR